MGLDYLAAVLLQAGVEVRIADLDIIGISALEGELRTYSPDLVGITNMSIQNDVANQVARIAKKLLPSAVIVKGGPHETFAWEATLSLHHAYVDACVVGEGEQTLREISVSLCNGTFQASRGSIRGMAHWDGQNPQIPHQHQCPVDLDSLLPARLVFHERYNFDVFRGAKTAQLMASRGCRNACRYCAESVSLDGGRERRRSMDSICRELEQLRGEGYEAVYLDDSTFTRHREWSLEVGEALRRAGMIWGCNTRVDCLDEDLLRRMKELGCVYLFCGVESAVPEVLRGLRKTATPQRYVEQTRTVYRAMRELGIPCSVFLLFGAAREQRVGCIKTYEPESPEDARRSIEFSVRELDPDYLSMNVLRLLPGLPFSTEAEFECIRPTGRGHVHGGHYDAVWYAAHGKQDIRSRHPIFRAFEGCASVNPPQMTPERCYELLEFAVTAVNRKNAEPGTAQTEIVVDPRFGRFLKASTCSGSLQYELAPQTVIDDEAETERGVAQQ